MRQGLGPSSGPLAHRMGAPIHIHPPPPLAHREGAPLSSQGTPQGRTASISMSQFWLLLLSTDWGPWAHRVGTPHHINATAFSTAALAHHLAGDRERTASGAPQNGHIIMTHEIRSINHGAGPSSRSDQASGSGDQIKQIPHTCTCGLGGPEAQGQGARTRAG